MDTVPKPRLYHTAIVFESLKVLFFVYCFLLSIDLMAISFESFGSGFTHFFDHATANPFAGLIIGIVVTSIVQSSSMTTSVVVAMTGAGALTLDHAIPVILGANIGTTVTNTIVSFAYVGRKQEFEPSFGASIVHDIFNVYSVLLFFPLQLATGFLAFLAVKATGIFKDCGGFTFVSPLKYILHPVTLQASGVVSNKIILLVLALLLLFFSLSQIVKSMKSMIMQRVEVMLNKYLFRNMFISLVFGLVLTATVQSSSIATSLIVPLVAAGMLTIEQVFPYTLGANMGTTITAILAALGMGREIALTVAFAHMIFNMCGTCVFLPLRKLPIWTAKTIAKYVAKSKKNFFIFLGIYVSLHTIVILLIFL